VRPSPTEAGLPDSSCAGWEGKAEAMKERGALSMSTSKLAEEGRITIKSVKRVDNGLSPVSKHGSRVKCWPSGTLEADLGKDKTAVPSPPS